MSEQRRITQDHHKLYTIKQNKVSFTLFDDKRLILYNMECILMHMGTSEMKKIKKKNSKKKHEKKKLKKRRDG